MQTQFLTIQKAKSTFPVTWQPSLLEIIQRETRPLALREIFSNRKIGQVTRFGELLQHSDMESAVRTELTQRYRAMVVNVQPFAATTQAVAVYFDAQVMLRPRIADPIALLFPLFHPFEQQWDTLVERMLQLASTPEGNRDGWRWRDPLADLVDAWSNRLSFCSLGSVTRNLAWRCAAANQKLCFGMGMTQ